MPDSLTTLQKLKICIASSKSYRFVLLTGIVFIVVGSVLVALGFRLDVLFMILFGGFFAGFALVFLIYTIPSSAMNAYEKALVAKYGRNKKAVVKEKNCIDTSYDNKPMFLLGKKRKNTFVSQLNYQLTFSFEYKGQSFEAADFIDKDIYDHLKIGDEIPVIFLSTRPQLASIRQRALQNQHRQNVTLLNPRF